MRLLASSLSTLIIGLLLVSLAPTTATAHCQVPCGIYDDAARINAMLEDTTTITKAMKQLDELAGKSDATSQNQRVRWVVTKETHASHVIEVISTYFLTQKLKRPDPKDAKA